MSIPIIRRALLAAAFAAVCAASAAAVGRPQPVYVAELPNINDYTLFANGGWDGNWYVGFNVCWMEQLPQPPPGRYARAFVGVKLGRMKTRTVPGKTTWEKEPIPGAVYVAVSSTSAWRSSQKHLAADTRDIPLDGDPANALDGVGEARWFWAEVPLAEISMKGPSYVAVWSPSEYLTGASSAPIIAGGWGSQKVNSWMNNDVKGYAPIVPGTALKTPITVFEPAIALKLVPEGCAQQVLVEISTVTAGRERTSDQTIVADVTGDAIEKAWLELSADGAVWEKHGRALWQPPYTFTLKPASVPPGIWRVRVSAVDQWGNGGASEPFAVAVSTVAAR